MKKIKILLLINWHIKYLDKEDLNIQPSDQCFDDKFWFFKYFKDEVSVDVVDTRSIKWIEKFEKNKLHFYIMQTLRVLPKLNNYDLIISHGTTSGIFLDLLHSFLKFKMPPHIVIDISSFHKASNKGMIFKLCRYASKSVGYLIYHTPIQREYFDKYFPWLKDKKSFLTFGVDGHYWGKKEYPVLRRDKYIISVGYRRRDWETLINAYNKSSQDYKLLLVGNGQIKVSNPNIEILPFIPVAQLMGYVKNAKFCILSLDYLPFSYGQMTLLQQMALGKVVVAADVPSLSPYESDGLKKYKVRDVEDLCKILNNLYNLSDLKLQYLGEKNRKIINDKYSEEKMADKLEKICRIVLRNEKNGKSSD